MQNNIEYTENDIDSELEFIRNRLAPQREIELPKNLTSSMLFDKMDSIEPEILVKASVTNKVLDFYRSMRPTLNYAAVFLFIVVVYYSLGLNETANYTDSAAPMSSSTAYTATPRMDAPQAVAYDMNEEQAETTAGAPELEDKLLYDESIDYINRHGEITNKETMDNFLATVSGGESAYMRKVDITVEGDPIITDISFDGEMFTVVYDTTHDAYGSGEITTTAYKNYITYSKDGFLWHYFANTDKSDEIEQGDNAFLLLREVIVAE